ncbi:MAG: molybdopterin molybdenumtransferase MoeA, partial [Pyrobaculum sp.]
MRYLTGLNPISKVADILPQVRKIEDVVKIATWDATWHVVAKDVVAPHDYPPMPRAAYDGYAVNSEDTPGIFRIVGT